MISRSASSLKDLSPKTQKLGGKSFTVGNGHYLLDGKPFQILAGGMHYFRTVPEQWPHRLRLIKDMGLNTVDTYVPWNFHERRLGEYSFDGLRDVERFLEDAAEAGLYAIVRPGPYICSEWDNGGLPAWLLADRQMRLRSSDRRFMEPLDAWFDELMPRLAGHQISAGGNIIAMQIENDYARFGSDRHYGEMLRDGLRRRGIDVPLYVCEAPDEVGAGAEGLGEVIGSVWVEYEPEAGLAALKRQRPDDPAFLSELVCGPIQHWGEPLQRRDATLGAEMLRATVDAGASLSLYMAHGGTNFGMWSGANSVDELFLPAVTSYDYDSPINESGMPTEKYWRFREILLPDALKLDVETPSSLPTGTVRMQPAGRLLDPQLGFWGKVEQRQEPATFEEVGQQSGFVLYRTTVSVRPGRHLLRLDGLADRALVFIDGQERALLERNGATSAQLEFINPQSRLEILVESLGRVNFSPDLGEKKGFRGARLDLRWIDDWLTIPINLDDVSSVGGNDDLTTGPKFFYGTLDVDAPYDAFLGLRNWVKGYVWVNGFCLGRYWNKGPLLSLYMPGPLLTKGRNDIVVLEIHSGQARESYIEILSKHDQI